ncbi:AlpA family phage regulatory protein [Pasteurellaceae bacterium HPA106]|uniref:helix-turn-helix transcriptional regulator n=1 Tax=Spirabiliibacterium pneumoniae TaxID=221400 RepID=UPI001AADDB41|nr:AlpA family phage regulatory protein [Spirabiliibacterium pneumoniae]MBE2896241.1 AlpA family phage regulatory protein [Spirabiliibacterium pneumoniae]
MVEPTTDKSIIRLARTAQKCGVSKTTVHNWTNPNSKHYRADFPKKIRLGENSVGFWLHEVDAYLEKLANQGA